MRISVETDRCCGAGQCVLTAPAVFDQREDDGLVRLVDAEPAVALHEDVRLAGSLCPSGAISVYEN